MATKASETGSATHYLGPELQNLHGWFDNSLPPLVRIAPGDVVVYKTADAGWDERTPDMPRGQVDGLLTNFASVPAEGAAAVAAPGRRRSDGAGHALTGPIWIEGAEPGDTLAVHVREIVARAWGFGVHRPGKAAISGILGGQPDDVKETYFRHYFLDREHGVWRFNDRVEIPLAPFMGIFGVAPATAGRIPTAHPGPHGGNLDCKELGQDATVYLPVLVPGGLFSVGDGHGAQGDGEVDGAAIETGMDRLVLQFRLRKDLAIKRPRAETPTHLLFLAFDEDLDTAVLEATRDVIAYLMVDQSLTHGEAYNLASLAVDFRITQVVDGLKGVHAMLPKRIFLSSQPSFSRMSTRTTRLLATRFA